MASREAIPAGHPSLFTQKQKSEGKRSGVSP